MITRVSLDLCGFVRDRADYAITLRDAQAVRGAPAYPGIRTVLTSHSTITDVRTPQALERYVSLSELEDALGTGAGLSRFNVCSTSMARSALDFLSSLAAMAVIPATSRSTASGPQRRTMPIPGIEAIGTSTSGGRAMALGLQVHTLETSV